MVTAARLMMAWVVLGGTLIGACAPAEVDLTIRNETSGTWVALFVKPEDQSGFGIDELRGLIVPPGQSFEVKDLGDRERYDVRVQDTAGFTYETGVRLSFDDEVVVVTDSDVVTGDARMVIENGTSMAFDNLFVKDRSDDAWGADRVVTALQPGGKLELFLPVRRVYDIRAEAPDAVYETDTQLFDKQVSLRLTVNHLVTTARLRIVNDIDYGNGGDNDLVAVFVRQAGQTEWGPDRLLSTIPDGGAVWTLDVPPGEAGVVDVKAVDESGKIYERRGVEITAGWAFDVRFTATDVVP